MLGLAETVDLVEEQDGCEAVQIAVGQCLFHHLADVGHTGVDRGEFHKVAARAVGDGLSERCFAGTGRPPEDDGHRALLARDVGREADQR